MHCRKKDIWEALAHHRLPLSVPKCVYFALRSALFLLFFLISFSSTLLLFPVPRTTSGYSLAIGCSIFLELPVVYEGTNFNKCMGIYSSRFLAAATASLFASLFPLILTWLNLAEHHVFVAVFQLVYLMYQCITHRMRSSYICKYS